MTKIDIMNLAGAWSEMSNEEWEKMKEDIRELKKINKGLNYRYK